MASSIPEQGEVMDASLLSTSRSVASAPSISSSLPDMAEEHLSSAAATADNEKSTKTTAVVTQSQHRQQGSPAALCRESGRRGYVRTILTIGTNT